MEPFRDETELVAELAALRPPPGPAFAAELDERAASGFPRRSRFGSSPRAWLGERIHAIQPRRALIPAGATALAAVAAVTVVVALNEPGGERLLIGRDGPDAAGAPTKPVAPSTPSGGRSAGAEFRGYAPGSQSLPQPPGEASSAASSQALPTPDVHTSAPPLDRNSSFALQAPRRDIERSAEIVLGADAAEVGKDAARVFEAVHAHRGIVLRSSIRDGEDAVARFELLIPSARLGDALAAFSAIAEVRSRHEATADITAPTVRTGELLRDSRARIDGLLAQLSRADTDAERTAVESQLRAERDQAAYLRSQLATLERRATFSRVSLRIETGAAAASPGDGSGWGVGDALGDAGHILGIAAGVTIVVLAILGPVALIVALAWLANGARIRRSRERALE
jgi:hypothetical protein